MRHDDRLSARSDCSNAVLPYDSIYCIVAGAVVDTGGLVCGNARGELSAHDAADASGLQRAYALSGHCAPTRRDGDNRHLCNAWASYPQSVDGGVRKLQLCNSPGMAARMRHPRCHSYSPGYGRLWAATASRPPPLRPPLLLPHVVPGAGSPRLATGHATHAVLWTAPRPAPLDATAARTKGARSLWRPSHPARGCRRSMCGRPCGSRQPADCRKPLPEPSASTQECPRRWTSRAGR